jgi:uncharacterized protein DUF3631
VTDLSHLIADIARRLLGPENTSLSNSTQLRFGNHGSLCVEIAGPKAGKWFDHEESIGGGSWELIRRKGRMSSVQASVWLKSEFGIDLSAEESNGKANGNFNIVATYPYCDERGNLLFEVVRLQPKTFRQRRPNGAGGWVWNTKGIRQVPYRLPQLLAAPVDQLIFIVEGEKDVDRLAEVGLLATCNPGGAAKPRPDGKPPKPKWRPELNPFFARRQVMVIPDNDDAGQFHARAVATNLVPLAARVAILELPGLPEKGDVSDWLKAGGTRQGLVALTRAAPPFEMPAVEAEPNESSPQWGIEGDEVDDEAADAIEITRLAKLGLLAWARERKSAAKRLGCPVGLLDKLIAFERAKTQVGNGTQGRPVEFFEPEPWPEAVDGAALLNELAEAIRRYVILELEAARAVALWVLFTHAFSVASFAPKLLITSPQKRSGKTRLIQVLSYLVRRALPASNISAATLFRVIEDHAPSLLMDEADTFMRENEELRGIVNSGFDKETAQVLRNVQVGDRWEARKFSTWCPQAIAGIGWLPETIIDRGFLITMKRKLPTEQVARLRRRDAGPLRELARKAARWTADHLSEIEASVPDMPADLNDRAADAWEICVAIADVAGGEWSRLARQVALAVSGDVTDESVGVSLLSDLRELFDSEPIEEDSDAGRHEVLFSSEIVAALVKREDRPWSEFKNGKPITTRQVAAILKGFKIRTNATVRRGTKHDKGYRREWFGDAFRRYLPARDP